MATKKLMCVLFGILVIPVWVLGSAVKVGAETVNYKVSAYITDFGSTPVGYTEGHLVGYYVRRGLAFFENGEVATYSHWGTFDFTKGVGPYLGYSIFTFEDGSTIGQKIQGPFEWAPDRKIRLFKGTGEYTKGTGRFGGIKGTVSFTGKELTPYSKETKSDVYFDAVATYTLPPK